MHNLLFVSCLMFVLSLVLAAPADAKGGKGGNGSTNSSRGNGQGGAVATRRSGQLDEEGDGEENQDENVSRVGSAPGASEARPMFRRGGFFRNLTNAWSAEQALQNERQQLDRRMAQAQQLREIAQRDGNLNLLASADRMEAEAIEHYSRRAAQLGVTDPSLNGGARNPVLPPIVTEPTLASGSGRNAALAPKVNEPTLAGGGEPEPQLASSVTVTTPQLKSVLVKRGTKPQ
jgi:hypothetical protein